MIPPSAGGHPREGFMRSRSPRFSLWLVAMLAVSPLAGPAHAQDDDLREILKACIKMAGDGLLEIPEARADRFLGKVKEETARCRGGQRAVKQLGVPWVDWSNYWGNGDATSKTNQRERGITLPGRHVLDRNTRGLDGALLDLEYQRMELIKFNLFDNLTYETYVKGGQDKGKAVVGPVVRIWKEMRLASNHPDFKFVETKNGEQVCKGPATRFRTVSGTCNDINNPAMGSTGMLFARNVQFESTYPDLGLNELARNRHGDRISLLKPDPQVISRKLFTRDQKDAAACNKGQGTGPNSTCDYQKAPFFNVIAAFWIQFMTHDWFTHMEEARNDKARTISPNMGCTTERVDNVERPISPQRAAELGCRPEDKMEAGLIADDVPVPTFTAKDGSGKTNTYWKRSPKTTRNFNTAWWDASQIYGYDDRSSRRMRRDPNDRAKLQMIQAHTGSTGDAFGYLPTFETSDPIQPEWTGQEAVAMPDNWSIGLSFLHNVFVREHNIFVDEFRQEVKESPEEDSGLRHPDRPNAVIKYKDIGPDDLFEIARLVVAAEIAKIHTIEWTTQLLYDEPLYAGMNANWSGLFNSVEGGAAAKLAAEKTAEVVKVLGQSRKEKWQNQFFSALAAGPGIIGTGANAPYPAGANSGVNHFGSPFNFPEEFMAVYRLHPLVPDMIEFRDLAKPNEIAKHVPVVETFRAKATPQMREGGLSNWAVSMGRQRLGLLLLKNHPQFLQNLNIRPRFDTTLDVPALDIIRDRERGVPRFNEFRRQIGLKSLTGFDDFIDKRLDPNKPDDQKTIDYQQGLVKALREVYGTHKCDASKIITTAQVSRDEQGKPVPINDCLDPKKKTGDEVDNIEDVDIVVGFLAETTRPHGFAISETQFHIFIINASRRLYSDRFFTSSFRPEYYTTFGRNWVVNNGPEVKKESDLDNGHEMVMLPMKRVLLRTMPELEKELESVVNAFDPWARDRKADGKYYSLKWSARPDAKDDPAFGK
jgi:hypothetical protein